MAARSLQEQIDATPSGGVLRLLPGEYREQVVIRRPMTLEGRGRSCWIGNDATPVVSIECGGVVLRNLMVEALSGPSMPAVVAKAGTAPLLDSVFLRGEVIGVPAGNLRLQGEPLPAAPPPIEPSAGSSHGASDRISRRVEKLMNQAEEAEDTGNLASAKMLYEEVLELQPGNLEAAKFLQVLQRKLSVSAVAPLQVVPGAPGHRRIRVWDVDTLQAALRQGSAGDTIVLAPGVYRLGIVLDRDLFLEGEGTRDQVVLEAIDAPCVRSTAGGGLRSLTVRGLRNSGPARHAALRIEGTLKLDECDISSESHVGIEVIGPGAVPQLADCAVRNCASTAVWIHERGAGTFERCDVHDNKFFGVEVKEHGSPTFRSCSIHDCEGSGVHVWQSGAGTFENCDISRNKFAGVEVKDQGNPTFRGCKIHDGEGAGVLVHDSGAGTFEDCFVFGMKLSGVEVKRNGNPVFRACKIHDCERSGVLVYESGAGAFESCDVLGNKHSGVEVKQQGNPTLRDSMVHGCEGYGLQVYEAGEGVFENCDIFGNKYSGVEVKQHGNPVLRACKIHDCEGGLSVFGSGAGTFENCNIFGNKLGGVVVHKEGNPSLRGCVVRDNLGVGIGVASTGRGMFVSCRCSGNRGDWWVDSTSVLGAENESSDDSVPKALRGSATRASESALRHAEPPMAYPLLPVGGGEGPPGGLASKAVPNYDEERVPCSDELCTGTINIRGVCNYCSRAVART